MFIARLCILPTWIEVATEAMKVGCLFCIGILNFLSCRVRYQYGNHNGHKATKALFWNDLLIVSAA